MSNQKTNHTRRDDAPVEYIYTAYITTRNGRKIYAKSYGLSAFRIAVQTNKQ